MGEGGTRELLEGRAGREKAQRVFLVPCGERCQREDISLALLGLESNQLSHEHLQATLSIRAPARKPSHHSISCGFGPGFSSLQSPHCVLCLCQKNTSPSSWCELLSRGHKFGIVFAPNSYRVYDETIFSLFKKPSSFTYRA